MDIFQFRTKKYWWMDVVFYFAVSLLVATLLCYLIFLVKNSSQRKEIIVVSEKLRTVGTYQQKEYDDEVISYQKKIQDFTLLFKNHEFASNVFALLQDTTMPNIWYSRFILDQKNRSVQISGEADSMDGFSRQIKVFENNEYVKNITTLNSALGDSARIQFSVNLSLNPNIFGYLAKVSSLLKQASQQTVAKPATSSAQIIAKSSEKMITAFHLLLVPEVAGKVDQDYLRISITVPYGTDVTRLIPSIVTSPGASVTPLSNEIKDFTNPVTYTVKAEDGTTQNYTATVAVAPQPVPAKKSSAGQIAVLVMIIIAALAVVIIAGYVVWQKMKIKKHDN